MNFRSKKWTVLLLMFLIVLATGVVIQFSMGGALSNNLRSLFKNTIINNPFNIQSEVSISLIDSKISLDFGIIDADRFVFQNFVQNWFGVREVIRSVKFGIDENLTQILSPILPAKLILKIDNKFISFKSQNLPGLKTALTGTDINFATGSGRLKIKYVSPTQYQLNIENPQEIAEYATQSGILTTSSKIEGLFKSLPQVATIELSVSGKNIAGKIVLK